MKAIRIHSYGGPEVLRLEELPTPTPSAGEALIRIHAAGVNFLDIQKRRGELTPRLSVMRRVSLAISEREEMMLRKHTRR